MSPFMFWGCAEIRESLNVHADNLRDFAEQLEIVPADSVYYHSVRVMLRHRVELPPFADDFSWWVDHQVRSTALAERMALTSPFDFPDIEGFRSHLLDILDDELRQTGFPGAGFVPEPFYFLSSHLTAIPLHLSASNIDEFREVLAHVDESSIYFHAVEALGRHHEHGDFASWIEHEIGDATLAQTMGDINPFATSLERTRALMLAAIDRRRQEVGA